MKKILITGASGFLGQLAIEFFKKYNVYLIDKIIWLLYTSDAADDLGEV